ncbi:MAG: N-acetylmuramoyl-L-alanine amidase [Armatimonadia bacterium]
MSRKSTNWIVLHCSATRGVQDIGAADIRRWHKDKGWKDIGYHFVIRRDGKVEKGRAIDAIGSHVQGHNINSVGICLVGGIDDKTWQPADNFTAAQWKSLKQLVDTLVKRYPAAKVLGHRDFPKVQKACPCFEAKVWAKKNGFPV